MYQIRCFNGSTEYYVYDPRVKEYSVMAPRLSLELNKSGILTFGVPNTHPNKAQILSLTSDIVVYENNTPIWYGRSITKDSDFYKTGRITCEGELAFLYDSIYRPFSYAGTITQFLTNLINNHNSQVEARKQFTLGTVSVVDSNGNVARSSEDALKTLDVISTRLINTNGGYLRVRHVGAIRYLDYLVDYGNTAPQVIEFAKNLIDLDQFIDATKIRTCLIPYGAEITGSAAGERVDIKTVNGGLDYISNAGAAASFGQIWETVTFKDVTLPANLLTKAQAYLSEMIAQSLTLKLSAVDMSVLGVETRIDVGDWVRVRSIPHGLDALFLATARNIDMANPESTKISFGNTQQSFTTQNNQKKLEVSQSVDDITARVLLATQLITGAVGGSVVLDPPEKPSRILIMDTPDKETALNVWQWNINGLGHSSTGINGPYTTAWTIDGHFNANFIDTGILLASLLKVGGTGTPGVLSVKNALNAEMVRLDVNGITMADGTTIVGGNGVRSTLVFNSEDFADIGFWNPSYAESVFDLRTPSLEYFIPNNFVVESAILYLCLYPQYSYGAYFDGVARTEYGYPRQVKTYKQTDPRKKCHIHYYAIDEDVELGIGSDITSACFGVSSIAPSAPASPPNTALIIGTNYTSNNITAQLTSGAGKLIFVPVEPTWGVDNQEIEAFRFSGNLTAHLVVVGYKK